MTAPALLFLIVAAFAGSACQGTISPSQALAASGEEFLQLDTVVGRLHIVIESDGARIIFDGSISYGQRELAYYEMSTTTEAGGSRTTVDTLIIPDDLYVRLPDGTWYVLSPWHQGTRPENIPDTNMPEDFVDYKKLTEKLSAVERLEGETIDGVRHSHYVGEAPLSEISPTTGGLFEGTTHVDIWVNEETDLPLRAVYQGTAEGDVGAFDFTSEVTFEYNRPISPPEAPEDARPWRDLEFPGAPCTGSGFARCLQAQDELAPGSNATCDGAGRRLCLAPVGLVSADLIRELKAYYERDYGIRVIVLTPLELPESSVDEERQQADYVDLMQQVYAHFPEAFDDPEAVLLAVTALDLYNRESHYRYVFGNKWTYEYPKGVVSTFRMDPQFYGEPPDDELTLTRSRKLITKYVGMLYFGLATSTDPTSPMFDAILGPDDLDRMQEPMIVD